MRKGRSRRPDVRGRVGAVAAVVADVAGLEGGWVLLLMLLLSSGGGRRRDRGGSASWGPATTCCGGCCWARPGEEAAVRCFTLSEGASPDQDMDELCGRITATMSYEPRAESRANLPTGA